MGALQVRPACGAPDRSYFCGARERTSGMNIRVDEEKLSIEKFGVGQPVLRNEDPKLVRGEGSYTDDVHAPGEVFAAMVRSPYAHGDIKSIDTEAARAMP